MRFNASIVVTVLAMVCWSILIEPGLMITRHEKLTKWQYEPLKIVFFSDLHAGAPHIDLAYIDRLVSEINSQTPQLILIGGDLVINGVIGGRAPAFTDVAKILGNLRATHGVFAVLGNHDWWNETDVIREKLEANGIRVLENQSTLIHISEKSKLNLIGIGDDFTAHADADAAFAESKSEYPKIVLMHDPGAALNMQQTFDLALAGHTHGGQIYLPIYGALVTPGRAPRKWARGWVHSKLGPLFVSTGLGTSILPIRFNAPPEFVVLELGSSN